MKRNRLSVDTYVSGVLNGDRMILSRAITLVESTLEEDQILAEQVMEKVIPHSGKSIRIGITGVPGVGKSTFIESFGSLLVARGHRLAVLAIDPSSQKSRGSILGDKTRMERLASDKRAYIRPSPAGSTLGGVSAKTREAMLLCEAAGFDVVFIETVGSGNRKLPSKVWLTFFCYSCLQVQETNCRGSKKEL
ncbi:putative periplasmic protein kinase ArgK [Indibacter alkaliphilus LW1]|uniref:Periplasmic protein kinase ArgK n=1 Tax=Indibacter alkaliphilus (strain CCUG 57479 / KCTC 22604 / LW1) TaxID=1189612 RepID=S2DMT6_INDAL|nr:putative periplasmic protein kinase ArgK [Indibacter alkaliphilus LW1]